MMNDGKNGSRIQIRLAVRPQSKFRNEVTRNALMQPRAVEQPNHLIVSRKVRTCCLAAFFPIVDTNALLVLSAESQM